MVTNSFHTSIGVTLRGAGRKGRREGRSGSEGTLHHINTSTMVTCRKIVMRGGMGSELSGRERKGGAKAKGALPSEG